jgi:hypothetical protein
MKGDGIDPAKRVQIIQTPTGPLALYRPIAERLLKEGVISGVLDGALHATDAATVKAATVLSGVCDFCSAPGPSHDFMVPDFDMPNGAGRSADGWAACDDCAALVRAGKQKDLLLRSVERMAFGKFTKPAIAELHARFWRALNIVSEATGMAQALADWADNKIAVANAPVWHGEVTDRTRRVEALAKLIGCEVTELEPALSVGTSGHLTPEMVAKLHACWKRYGSAQTLTAQMSHPHRPRASVVPHWQQAFDEKVAMIARLQSMVKNADAVMAYASDMPTDLNDPKAVKALVVAAQKRELLKSLSVEEDLRFLRAADIYSFNAETEAAIREAATSLPCEAALSSIETPNTGTGWFWFSVPLPIASSPSASDTTDALLWSWVKEAPGMPGEAAICFSAYVRDTKGIGGDTPGALYPSTRWFWPVTLSFHQMLGYNLAAWRATYGPGGPLEHDKVNGGEAAITQTVTDLSHFFMQACLWFRQTVPGQPKKVLDPILQKADGHIERHARKRYEREFKQTPVVHVVALRKTARVELGDAPTERHDGARQYGCRWIVRGHPRLQPCGPGRKDRKLIWIESFVAGPDDQPLRTKTTVYAVVR